MSPDDLIHKKIKAGKEIVDIDMRTLGLGSLRDRQDEGVGIRVSEEWAVPLRTPAEREHAEWLDCTFFEREAYVSEEERANQP